MEHHQDDPRIADELRGALPPQLAVALDALEEHIKASTEVWRYEGRYVLVFVVPRGTPASIRHALSNALFFESHDKQYNVWPGCVRVLWWPRQEG